MNYQDAFELKHNVLGNTITRNDKTYNVYVAPSINAELQDFIKDYDEEAYNDKTCLQYSTDNQYQIYFIESTELKEELYV